MAELTTLARPYAKAAFEFADSQNALAQWSDMLSSVAVVAADETVGRALSNPSATAEQHAQTLVDLLGDSLDEKGINFVRNVAGNKRISLLGEISNLFDLMKAQREQMLDVEITSAYEVSGDEQNKLTEALSKNLNRQVTLSCDTDASLIGGALIHAGDTLIDGTVKGRLAKLTEAMSS